MRKRVIDIPEERRRHLTAYALVSVHGTRQGVVAALSGVTTRTIRTWVRLALTYPESADVEFLRSLVS